MRTLYIPTTTLNFNNILSSESISPSAFYGRREFGYKNWHKIDENPFDNSILLYDKMPQVNRTASDYDDYPLIFAVSVSDDTFEGMNEVCPGVFQYDKTVYLNPYSTAIFFATDNHKRIAISKSESSAETKMIRLYQGRMVVARPGDSVNISNIQDTELNAKAVEDDKRINRMKGLLYGYFIGAALSMNSKDVEKLNVLNEIKNVFAAILASLNRRATQEQINQLQVLFKRLERFDPIRIEVDGILTDSESSNEEKADRIMSLVKRSAYNLSTPSLNQLVNEVQADRTEYGENKALVWVKHEITNLKQLSEKNNSLLQPSQGEIFLSNMSLTTINSELVKKGMPSELYRALINEVFSSEEFNGKISTFKQELATAVTRKAKEIYGEQWDERCLAKNYLNALRRHVAGESFEQQWNAGVLSAVASVILKGDDWEKLLEFLHSKGIADYRLAFSIYGTLNGFANLTRDFTDVILSEAKEYVKGVYFFFHQQLFGVSIEETTVPKHELPVHSDKLRPEIETIIGTLSRNQQKSVRPKIEQALEMEARQGDFQAFLFILNNLINTRTKIYRELKSVLEASATSGKPLKELVNYELNKFGKKDADKIAVVKQALELEDKIGDPKAFCFMLDDFKLSKEIQKRFYEHFQIYPNGGGRLSNQKGVEDGWLNFGEDPVEKTTTVREEKPNIYNVESIMKAIAPFLSEENKKTVYRDLSWILDSWYAKDKSKEQIIEEIRGKLMEGLTAKLSKNKKSLDWKNKQYASLDINGIINLLKKRFL